MILGCNHVGKISLCDDCAKANELETLRAQLAALRERVREAEGICAVLTSHGPANIITAHRMATDFLASRAGGG